MPEAKSALITGVTGQDGSYLAELLLDLGYRVIGMTRRSSTPDTRHIDHLLSRLTFVPGDLLDQRSIVDLLREHRPAEVYNLAAQSFAPASWAQPVSTGEVTALGAVRVLEAIRTVDPSIRFYQASSAEMFGNAPESPQNEQTPLSPRSPYGAAKAYAHWMTASYRENYRMHASSGILFNHESARRGVEFVTRKISHAAAQIKLGLATELPLGNLGVMRDWGYAPDYVRAMWLMLQQDAPGDYVVATGEQHSVREFCELAFRHVGLDYRQYVIQDPRFMRINQVETLVGNPAKARRMLGWAPELTFEELVKHMVESDLRRLTPAGDR